jgi:hypothetical protein
MSTPNSQETSWMLIHRAVEGNVDARDEFVRRYEPAARRYLGARWNGTPYIQQLEDAVQQVFLECFRDGSALPCVDGERRFSGFLRGVVNRVAQEFETGKARLSNRQAVPVDEMSASRAFDRAYAKDEMRRAHELLMAHARENGERHVRRVDLLRLPVVDGTLIRNLAAQWGEEAKQVSWEYEKVRVEFKYALRAVLRLHEQCPENKIEEEMLHILALAP